MTKQSFVETHADLIDTVAMSNRHVTVIGNGIVGLACAYHLRSDGWDVTVIDRTDVDEGTSTGNAGAIAAAEVAPIAYPGLWKRVPGMLMDPLGPLHLPPKHIPKLMPWMWHFLRACRPHNFERGVAAIGAITSQVIDDHMRVLKDIGAEELIANRGGLTVYRSAEGFAQAEKDWELLGRFGFEGKRLSASALKDMEPAFGPNVIGGYHTDQWAHYRDPKELVCVFADALKARGVVIEKAAVMELDVADGRVTHLHLSDATCREVDRLVICAGAWSGALSKQLGEPFPIEADRGYNTTLPAPGIELTNYVTFAEDSFVATPMSIGLRIGGAVELGGLTAAPNYERSRALVTLARRYLPGLKDEGGTQWMGHRPGTPDSVPVISKSTRALNVAYAFGHGHLGLTMSMTTGRLVSALLDERDPGMDMSPYRIDRF